MDIGGLEIDYDPDDCELFITATDIYRRVFKLTYKAFGADYLAIYVADLIRLLVPAEVVAAVAAALG